MENVVERINILSNKKSKIGVADSLKAAGLIYQVYESEKRIDIIINYLNNFYYKVMSVFVREFYFKLSKQEKEKFIKLFVQNKKFEENSGNSSVFKGLSILEEIIKRDIEDDNIMYLIGNICRVAEKNGRFGNAVKKSFIDFLKNTGDIFLELDFELMDDVIRKRMFRYINDSIQNVSDFAYKDKVKKIGEKYSYKFTFENIPHIGAIDKSDTLGNGKNKEDQTRINKWIDSNETKLNELSRTLKSANDEAKKLFESIFENNMTVKSLQEQIKNKDYEISSIKAQEQNKTAKIEEMDSKINDLISQINNKNIEIDDLKKRLKISFKVDNISKNQEIITLKNDIAAALKLQYEDFNEYKDEECNEDNYEALKVTLNQVFRTLKRYGIEL